MGLAKPSRSSSSCPFCSGPHARKKPGFCGSGRVCGPRADPCSLWAGGERWLAQSLVRCCLTHRSARHFLRFLLSLALPTACRPLYLSFFDPSLTKTNHPERPSPEEPRLPSFRTPLCGYNFFLSPLSSLVAVFTFIRAAASTCRRLSVAVVFSPDSLLRESLYLGPASLPKPSGPPVSPAASLFHVEPLLSIRPFFRVASSFRAARVFFGSLWIGDIHCTCKGKFVLFLACPHSIRHSPLPRPGQRATSPPESEPISFASPSVHQTSHSTGHHRISRPLLALLPSASRFYSPCREGCAIFRKLTE